MLKLLGIGALVALAGAAALGFWTHGRDLAQRDRVWGSLLAGREAQPPVLDPAMTRGWRGQNTDLAGLSSMK